MIERLIVVGFGVFGAVLLELVLQRRRRIRIYRMMAVAASRNTGGRMDPREQQQKAGDPSSVARDQSTVGGRRPQGVPDREYQDINQRFTPIVPTGDQKQTLNQIMFSTKDLAEFVIGNIPNNRERSLALTKLEEFGHWCEKGLLHGVTSGISG